MRILEFLTRKVPPMNALQVTWFCLIGVLLAGYIILDGFDLGVGIWYLFARKDKDRRSLMASITPYWDGNEVWLLTGGGAVFAAFPHVVRNGIQRVLPCYYAGAVCIDLSGGSDRVSASIRPAGLAKGMGHRLRGRQHCPRAAPRSGCRKHFPGCAAGLLKELHRHFLHTAKPLFDSCWHHRPCNVCNARCTVGSYQNQWRTCGKGAWLGSRKWNCVLRAAVGIVHSNYFRPGRVNSQLLRTPCAMGNPGIDGSVFSRHSCIYVGPQSDSSIPRVVFGDGADPRINSYRALSPHVPAVGNLGYSLTIANALSSELTLKTMLILTIIGMPIVLAYTVWVHWLFRRRGDKEAGY